MFSNPSGAVNLYYCSIGIKLKCIILSLSCYVKIQYPVPYVFVISGIEIRKGELTKDVGWFGQLNWGQTNHFAIFVCKSLFQCFYFGVVYVFTGISSISLAVCIYLCFVFSLIHLYHLNKYFIWHRCLFCLWVCFLIYTLWCHNTVRFQHTWFWQKVP